MKHYPINNLLREATEVWSALTLFALAFLIHQLPHLFLLISATSHYMVLSFIVPGCYRAWQATQVKRYHHRLLAMPSYSLSATKIPLSKQWLFIGRGFRWRTNHTQQLYQIKQVHNERFMQRNKCYQVVRRFCQRYEKTLLARKFNNKSLLNPFRPDPPVGGSSFLHGVGDEDKSVFIPQAVRVGHTFVVGTTRVGKTRLASILINQDIRNGDAVIVVDPKGDQELVRDIKEACSVAGRSDDFHLVHLGFPEQSAHYNPLKNYDQVSEVATRVTDAISAEGEGKQFSAFAWKYVNIVAMCLEAMRLDITYQSIAFYITRLEQLLMVYADTVLSPYYPHYQEAIDTIIVEHDSKIGKNNKTKPRMERHQAVIELVKNHISQMIKNKDSKNLNNSLLIDLYDAAIMDKQYYDKITASVGPVLAEINKSNASCILCPPEHLNAIELMDVIKQKKILYIGLDSLTNPNIAQAVGKALLSDLVSTAGKLYKEADAQYILNLHCDELSEFIQDSFVKILNKAGGAGFQITAYAQTIQDMEVALGSQAKAQMSEGNFNTLIMMRVKNEATANLLVKVLPQVEVIGHTQASQVNDAPHGTDSVYFNTTNEDRLQTTSVPMIGVDDIIALPKGQAFILVNGGKVYKVRIPAIAS